MKRAATLACSALLALCASLRAADPTPLPSATTLPLKDGRVLHNVKVMEDEGESVVVKADEGLLKIAKNLLPAGFVETAPPAPAAGSQMVMEPFNPNLAPEPAPAKKPAPAPRPAAPVKAAPNPVYKGCTIMSFQPKTFGTILGAAEVVVRNDTDNPVLLQPRDFACLTVGGQRYGGRVIISDGVPPMTKRKEVVPAHGQIDDIVTFTNEALEFTGVQWAR